MNINTLIDALAVAIASDSVTTAWSTAAYGQSHQVFLNVDRRNPPGEDECPFVIIYPLGKSAGESQARKVHTVEVDVCLHDESSDTLANVQGVTTYAGLGNLETFRKHVENAVVGASIGRCAVDALEVEFNTIDSFPFMWAGMIFRIGEDVLIGSDPLE